MCGIVGIVSSKNKFKSAFSALKSLEYRGYDSFGFGAVKDDSIKTIKKTGAISETNINEFADLFEANTIIGLSRLSTHGGVTKNNSHPHSSSSKNISIVHNGVIAVGVKLEGGSEETAKDIAMHISAMKPVYTKNEDIPEEAMTKIKEMFEKEVAEENKPEDIKAKILEGKINSYFKALTLLDQNFIKDSNKTIEQVLKEAKATLTSFVIEQI